MFGIDHLDVHPTKQLSKDKHTPKKQKILERVKATAKFPTAQVKRIIIFSELWIDVDVTFGFDRLERDNIKVISGIYQNPDSPNKVKSNFTVTGMDGVTLNLLLENQSEKLGDASAKAVVDVRVPRGYSDLETLLIYTKQGSFKYDETSLNRLPYVTNLHYESSLGKLKSKLVKASTAIIKTKANSIDTAFYVEKGVTLQTYDANITSRIFLQNADNSYVDVRAKNGSIDVSMLSKYSGLIGLRAFKGSTRIVDRGTNMNFELNEAKTRGYVFNTNLNPKQTNSSILLENNEGPISLQFS
ncbi:hypothetical protein AX774_g3404 [Zancudomyces culisetae]|uniref:Uncharacterized protein n=1 Tax=Zancudomyces culisetae TaxID=1213189 RepID=A0A1R1PQ27_ZANCU|nr:hypothetical protein AX774_g3404 [Zancudomyces culisetae]|eukprot:OMH83095.1 hypothetical protein AX774_g3404 [Zancudomyces culisetae]